MTAADHNLLAGIRGALVKPFADPVEVFGQRMSRGLARAIERQILAARKLA